MQTAQYEKITPIEAWSLFIACKLHFTPGKKYNAFAFNFKGPKCNRESFMKMGQRYAFEKIAKQFNNRENLIEYIVSNIVAGNTWIGDMNDHVYSVWSGRCQSLFYTFRGDMAKIAEVEPNFDSAIMPKDPTQIPCIYRMYRAGDISLESLACLELLLGFTSDLDKKLSDPFDIVSGLSHLVRAYSPFLSRYVDKKKLVEIIVSLFTKQQN